MVQEVPFDADGNLYLSDFYSNAIYHYGHDGSFISDGGSIFDPDDDDWEQDHDGMEFSLYGPQFDDFNIDGYGMAYGEFGGINLIGVIMKTLTLTPMIPRMVILFNSMAL